MTHSTRRQFLREIGAATVAASGLGVSAALAEQSQHGDEGSAPGGQQAPALEVHSVAEDTTALTSYVPLPSLGMVPVSAFLIRGTQPILVDTGLVATRKDFMAQLRSMIALEDIRWLWLTHTDPDHTGSLVQVLAEATNARLVTTFLGMGKLGLYPYPVDRAYLLNPGQSLNAGDRELLAVKPPTFDAPETTGFLDTKTRALFCADSFGALLQKPAENAADIPAAELRDGLVTWATVDAPWLNRVDASKFGESLHAVKNLEASTILSSHLPPATGMTETLLSHLDAARSAPFFMGPDQAALEKMLSGQTGK